MRRSSAVFIEALACLITESDLASDSDLPSWRRVLLTWQSLREILRCKFRSVEKRNRHSIVMQGKRSFD
jgi:hypothetical protein